MRSYHGFVMFLLGLMLGGGAIGMSMFLIQTEPPRKYLKCFTPNNKTKIGIMIDDQERLFTLEGEVIDKDKILNFTEYLIIAEWKHSRGSTAVDLDRLSGNLRIIERDRQGIEDSIEKFECQQAIQKF